MKRFLFILFALVLALALAVPARADTSVGTSVTVTPAGVSNPVVKCKWEQDTSGYLEDGNKSHDVYIGHGGLENSQFNPPVVKGASKMIVYYAVVTSDTDSGDVSQVFADVFSPPLSPPPYDKPNDAHGALFKYEVMFTKIPVGKNPNYSAENITTELNLINAAFNANLIYFQTNHSIDDVRTEITKQTAALWRGQALLTYEQPYGQYTVKCYASVGNTVSPMLQNKFKYVGISGVEIDFVSFNYGPVTMGQDTPRAGDTAWNPAPGVAGFNAVSPAGATIRNIGNTWAKVLITQDDMQFGKDSDGNWMVQYDARMGSVPTNIIHYSPNAGGTPALLPNQLGLSMKDELDLSINVLKVLPNHSPTDPYSGTITITSDILPFTSPVPGSVGGLPDP